MLLSLSVLRFFLPKTVYSYASSYLRPVHLFPSLICSLFHTACLSFIPLTLTFPPTHDLFISFIPSSVSMYNCYLLSISLFFPTPDLFLYSFHSYIASYLQLFSLTPSPGNFATGLFLLPYLLPTTSTTLVALNVYIYLSFILLIGAVCYDKRLHAVFHTLEFFPHRTKKRSRTELSKHFFIII